MYISIDIKIKNIVIFRIALWFLEIHHAFQNLISEEFWVNTGLTPSFREKDPIVTDHIIKDNEFSAHIFNLTYTKNGNFFTTNNIPVVTKAK